MNCTLEILRQWSHAHVPLKLEQTIVMGVHSPSYCYTRTPSCCNFDIELCSLGDVKTRPERSCPPNSEIGLQGLAVASYVHQVQNHLLKVISRSKSLRQFSQLSQLLHQVSLPLCSFSAKSHWAGLNIQFVAREIQSPAPLWTQLCAAWRRAKSLGLANKAPERKKYQQLCN